MARRVVWTKRATRQFNESIDYIRLVSDQNADKVREKILEKVMNYRMMQ